MLYVYRETHLESIPHVKRFIYFMDYRWKLINTSISRLKPESVCRDRFTFTETIEYIMV